VLPPQLQENDVLCLIRKSKLTHSRPKTGAAVVKSKFFILSSDFMNDLIGKCNEAAEFAGKDAARHRPDSEVTIVHALASRSKKQAKKGGSSSISDPYLQTKLDSLKQRLRNVIGASVAREDSSLTEKLFTELVESCCTTMQKVYQQEISGIAQAGKKGANQSDVNRKVWLETTFTDNHAEFFVFCKSVTKMSHCQDFAIDLLFDSVGVSLFGLISDYDRLERGDSPIKTVDDSPSTSKSAFPAHWLNLSLLKSNLPSSGPTASCLTQLCRVLESSPAERREHLQDLFKAIEQAAKQCGLPVRAIDSKVERATLHSYRLNMLQRIRPCDNPEKVLALSVGLLMQQCHQVALPIPGTAHLASHLDLFCELSATQLLETLGTERGGALQSLARAVRQDTMDKAYLASQSELVKEFAVLRDPVHGAL